MKQINLFYKQYIQNGRFESDFVLFETFIIEINQLISSTKKIYYENQGKKLNNPLLQAKTYWSIFKTFCTMKKNPLVSSLMVKDRFVTDIKTKANIFNNYFPEQ